LRKPPGAPRPAQPPGACSAGGEYGVPLLAKLLELPRQAIPYTEQALTKPVQEDDIPGKRLLLLPGRAQPERDGLPLTLPPFLRRPLSARHRQEHGVEGGDGSL